MCGRFVLEHASFTLETWYQATEIPAYTPRYNIASSTNIVVIRETEKVRRGLLMRWGFIPAWAKENASLPLLSNARGESVAEKPLFRQAFARQRCIIPASGFYEWQAIPGKKTKQPFYITSKDDNPLSFAGIWETWKKPDGTLLDSCAIITTCANAALASIHDRMPVILERDAWDIWLTSDPIPVERLQAFIQPCDAHKIQTWAVSTAVNRVTNDYPTLREPVAS